MELNANKDRKGKDRKPSLEALIQDIDCQVGQIPSLTTAEGFAGFLGGKAEDYQRQEKQYVRFMVADTLFALPLQNTLEIDYVPEIVSLPHLPQWVLGICNLRGDIVSVVDFKQILHLDPRKTDTIKKLILIQNKDTSTAIIVDKIAGMLFTNNDEGQTEPKAVTDEPFSMFVKDVFFFGRKTIHLLDLDALMAAIKL